MYKALLYDLDGVLVDAVAIHFDAFNLALEDISGFKISKDDEELFNGLPTLKKLEKLTEMGKILPKDHQIIWSKKQDLTEKAIKKHLSIDLIKKQLHVVTNELGLKSACVTNSITRTAKLMLELTGQWEYMEFLISNEMVRNAKPHPEGYIRAMIKMNVCPDECLIFEDSDKGKQSAYASGADVFEVNSVGDICLDKILPILKGKL